MKKKKKVKQSSRGVHRKKPSIREHYLFLFGKKKKGFPEAWKVFFSGRASIPLSGEGLTQTRASHTHPAAGNHIHFAIFFL